MRVTYDRVKYTFYVLQHVQPPCVDSTVNSTPSAVWYCHAWLEYSLHDGCCQTCWIAAHERLKQSCVSLHGIQHIQCLQALFQSKAKLSFLQMYRRSFWNDFPRNSLYADKVNGTSDPGRQSTSCPSG